MWPYVIGHRFSCAGFTKGAEQGFGCLANLQRSAMLESVVGIGHVLLGHSLPSAANHLAGHPCLCPDIPLPGDGVPLCATPQGAQLVSSAEIRGCKRDFHGQHPSPSWEVPVGVIAGCDCHRDVTARICLFVHVVLSILFLPPSLPRISRSDCGRVHPPMLNLCATLLPPWHGSHCGRLCLVSDKLFALSSLNHFADSLLRSYFMPKGQWEGKLVLCMGAAIKHFCIVPNFLGYFVKFC